MLYAREGGRAHPRGHDRGVRREAPKRNKPKNTCIYIYIYIERERDIHMYTHIIHNSTRLPYTGRDRCHLEDKHLGIRSCLLERDRRHLRQKLLAEAGSGMAAPACPYASRGRQPRILPVINCTATTYHLRLFQAIMNIYIIEINSNK